MKNDITSTLYRTWFKRHFSRTAPRFFNKTLFAAVLLFFFSHSLSAQDSSHLWTLQDCFDYADTHNIQLRMLQNDIVTSDQDLLQARAARLPDLSATTSQDFTNSKNANPVVGGFETQSNFASRYGLSSSMILYQGGGVKDNILSRQLAVQAANLNVKQSLNDLSIQITQAYLNILLAKESITAMQNVVATSEAQYENGKVLFNAGSISKNSLVQLQATLSSDQFNLVSDQNQLRQNILTLKQLLQLPAGYNFQVADNQNPGLPAETPDLQTVEDSALQNRPEIKIGENAIEQAQVGLKQAYSLTKPTITAGASLTSGYSNNSQMKYTSQLQDNFFQQVGINASFPIFDNRTNRTNVEKSKIAIEQSNLSFQNTKLALSQEVEQAYINLQNAEAQYKAAQVQFDANEENYRVANEQLKLGAANMVDFLVQKNQFIQAQQSLIQAKYSLILFHEIYEFYLGKPITL